MTEANIEDFLEHHGVKGQQWGVRKKASGKFTSGSKNKTPHPTKHLTNEQLKHRIDRMKLDMQYKELSSPIKAKTGGSKYAKTLLAKHGDKAVNTLITLGVTAGAVGIKKAFEVARNMASG